MRLLCFVDNLGSGGAQRQLVNLAVLFQCRGHDVEFLVYDSGDFFQPVLEKHSIPIARIRSRSHLERLLECRRYLRRAECDVVIAFLDTPNFLACFSAIGRRKWGLITNEVSARRSSFEEWRPRLLKFFQRYADMLICNSYNAQRLWLEYAPEYSGRIRVIYNPVLVDDACMRVRPEPSCKRRLVVAASCSDIKNPVLLAQAVAGLSSDERRRLRVDWYGRTEPARGDTSAYDATRNFVRNECLEDVMFFHEATDRIYDEMRAADVVGLFSEYEGLPNAICEAMTLEKPVMMTKVSDYEILVDARNGFLCESTDIHGIRTALEAMLSASDEDLTAKGQESGRRARQLFDPDRVACEWIDTFEVVVRR